MNKLLAPQKLYQLRTVDLIPYAKNSRTHSPEQIDQVANSIKEFGFTNPVLVDSENGIIAGHGRVMAAQQLGIETVPCIKLEHLSDKQKRAYIIADNKLALNSGWDEQTLNDELVDLKNLGFDLDVIGFDSDELKDLLFVELNIDDDDLNKIPIVEEHTISRLGDVWILDQHRVMCGDSTNIEDVEQLLQGDKIDLIFTDPPYGVSYADKNKFLNAGDRGNRNQTPIENDHLNIEQTGDLWSAVFSVWSKYLEDYSSYYITSPGGNGLFETMMEAMSANNMPYRHILIWNKNNHVLGRSDYNYKHEPILYGWSKKHKFYGGGNHRFSVWDIAKPLKNDLHPTMKPVALVENCIKTAARLECWLLICFWVVEQH